MRAHEPSGSQVGMNQTSGLAENLGVGYSFLNEDTEKLYSSSLKVTPNNLTELKKHVGNKLTL